MSVALLKKYLNMTYALLETELIDYVSGGGYRSGFAPETKDFPPTPKFQFHNSLPPNPAASKATSSASSNARSDARLEFISPALRKQAGTRSLIDQA